MRDITLKTRYGNTNCQLTALQWGSSDLPPVIALHGWLDNAASFWRLAPLLVSPLTANRQTVIAIDLPGHGQSDWLPAGYPVWAYVEALYPLFDQWPHFHLLGHSLGAGVCSLLASLMPDQVLSLGLIDGIAPLASPAEQSRDALKRYLDRRRQPGTEFRTYPSATQALAARRLSSPGVSEESILPMVERALQSRNDGVSWRMDPRLREPSPMRLTPDMVKGFLQGIECPTLAIRATEGLFTEDLFKRLTSEVQQVDVHQVPGHHHLHLDEFGAHAVADRYLNFRNAL